MKYACNLIRDLLPLYHDSAASSESVQAVEEHLGMCSACREYYDKICGSDVLEQAAYDKELTKKAAASYQRVYRKLVRKIGKIICITVLSVLLVLLLLYAAVVGYLYISAESSREIHRDMESYGYLDDGKNVLEVFADGEKPEGGIWREHITDDMEVQDYLLVYYHPWDANYLGLPRDGSVTLLDVRTKSEVAGGRIEGFSHIPLDSLREHLDEIPKDKPVYVHCHSGLRSYIACRILQGRGYDCYNLAGGYRLYETVAHEGKVAEYSCRECK